MSDIVQGGLMVYRCRLCGEEDDSTHCPSIVWAMARLNQKGCTHDDPPGIIKFMTELHSCADGRFGVADLIGFSPDKVEPIGSGR